MSKEIYKEIRSRIISHNNKDNKNLSSVNLIWRGYIAALMEWDNLNLEEYGKLIDLLDEICSINEEMEDEISRLFVDMEGEY